MQKRVMCKTMAQTPPFTHTYMSVYKQEGKHEMVYTRFLTLINFWREHGSEMGEGGRRASQAKIRVYSDNITCASMQNCMCLNIKKLIFTQKRLYIQMCLLVIFHTVHTALPHSF